MRSLFAVAFLFLVGACASPDSCISLCNLKPGPSYAGPRVRAYTNNASSPAAHEVIAVHIEGGFAAIDRDAIVQAFEEWNYALNGNLRFDAAASTAAAAAGGWIISPQAGGAPMPLKSTMIGQPLAITHRPMGAEIVGRVSVYVDRLGGRDLTAIMRHEIGHILGLAHGASETLMSAYYSAQNQACIDHSTMLGLATLRGLPFSSLNWCGEFAPNHAVAPLPWRPRLEFAAAAPPALPSVSRENPM